MHHFICNSQGRIYNFTIGPGNFLFCLQSPVRDVRDSKYHIFCLYGLLVRELGLQNKPIGGKLHNMNSGIDS